MAHLVCLEVRVREVSLDHLVAVGPLALLAHPDSLDHLDCLETLEYLDKMDSLVRISIF